MGMGIGMSTSYAPWLRNMRGSIQHGPSPWTGYSPSVSAFEDTRSPDYKQIRNLRSRYHSNTIRPGHQLLRLQQDLTI